MRIERNFFMHSGRYLGVHELHCKNGMYYWYYITMSQFLDPPDIPSIYVDSDDIIFIEERLNENNL